MSLETQLREALVKQGADELYRKFSSEPQYKAMIKAMIGEVIEEFGSSMIESIATYLGDVEPDEKEERLSECRAELLQLRAEFDNPEQLRQMVTEHVRNRHMTSDELRAKMGTQFKKKRENEDLDIDENAMTEFERVYEKVFEYVQENDRILNRLSEVAEAEGLEKATQKATRHEIIRERFPTAELFRDYSTRAQENLKTLFQEMPSALMADDEAGQLMGGMIGAICNAMKKMMKAEEKLIAYDLDKTIQEIYE